MKASYTEYGTVSPPNKTSIITPQPQGATVNA